MPTLKIIATTGENKSVEVAASGTVMEAIRDRGFNDLLALCGGGCACGTCHVYVDAATLERLPAMTSDERDLLDASAHRQQNSRLSCQLRVVSALDGAAFTVAPQD